MNGPTFGSLFSGIGGLDLGMERAGFRCLWQSEIDPYACQVLAKHWPTVPNLGDVRNIDWTTVPAPDVIVGGYPCQPFSTAGARNGTNDPRHLWPSFADAVRVVRPRHALLENVSGHLSLGFGHVLGDLAALGYDAEWDCVPAAAVGAPHLRDRVFVIATRRDGMDTDRDGEPTRALDGWPEPWAPVPMADADDRRHVHTQEPQKSDPRRRRQSSIGDSWQTEPPVGRVADGIPRRVDRLRTLGNAVVPQVAEHVARILADRLAATVPKPAKRYPAGQTPQIDPLTAWSRLNTQLSPARTGQNGGEAEPCRTVPGSRT